MVLPEGNSLPCSLPPERPPAVQPVYHFRVSAGAYAGRIPDLRLAREIGADEMPVPVRNRR